MNYYDTKNAASALANQLRVGIPLAQAVGRLTKLQPRNAAFWQEGQRRILDGNRASDVLADTWPDNLVSAIRAGEGSGKLAEVFAEIDRTLEAELTVINLMKKLIYPISLVGVGALIFLGFMAFVLPSIAKTIPESERGMLFRLSTLTESLVVNYWWALLIAAGFVVVLLKSWLASASGKQMLLDVVVSIPGLTSAASNLYFGLWANQMALMANAGIGTLEALEATAPALPSRFKDAILVAREDMLVNNRKMGEAFDPDRQTPDDSRQSLPFYVTNAFLIAEQTGEIDTELLRNAPVMLSDGIKGMNTFCGYANMAATLLAAFFIVAPLAVYYMQVFSVLNKL